MGFAGRAGAVQLAVAVVVAVAVGSGACGGNGLPPNHDHKTSNVFPGDTGRPMPASSLQRTTVGCPGALEGHGPRCPVLTKGESCFCICAPDTDAHCEAR
jgi:hypothetical protein